MDNRYPIGKFTFTPGNTPQQRAIAIDEIAAVPSKLRAAVAGLNDAQLDTPYRDGGWTVRQVVHHIPDSHLNSYVRFKLALTEDQPTVKAYDETKWAELVDAKTGPVEPSLKLLEALHDRWVRLMRSFSDGELQRKFTHTELGVVTIDQYIALYAWHGNHHIAHITSLRERNGW